MMLKYIIQTKLCTPTPLFIQAIPLFWKSNHAIFEYFRDHKAEIDAITGTTLIIPLPDEVAGGDASSLGALFAPGVKSTRYPFLLRSDMPCFWLEDSNGGHEIVRMPPKMDDLNALISAMTDAIYPGQKHTAKDVKAWALDRLQSDLSERSTFARILLGELPVSKSTERLIALICGVVFVACILAVALFIPSPSPFQYIVFRIVLSIAAAGFVSMTPGFLSITISNWLRAGGALAVFAIVYFYNPAALVVQTTPPIAATGAQTTVAK